MPKGVYERKPKEDHPMTEAAATEAPAIIPEAPQMFPVQLKKNYKPRGLFEVVGYLKEKIERKDSAGNKIVVEPERFIEGELKPPPYPGVGYDGKVWAGTHIRLPVDEAKAIIAKKIAERADAIAA